MIYTYSIKIQTDLSEGEILVNAMSEDEAMAIAEMEWLDGFHPEIEGNEILYIIPTSEGI
ncbi:MAG: hypothetical protein IIW42_06650 [Bacteroidaceae bacterium]|jgi:hypothetical protein|nr:hypothetical protein [Bacteroidaceae bacterium]